MTLSLSRTLLAAALLTLPMQAAHATTYTFDPSHTSVTFDIDHFGFSKPHGIFPMIEGTLNLDDAKPENSTVDVTVSPANVATGIPKLDEHLKSKDFFNVEKFPNVTFKSTKVEKTGDKTAKVTGDLTLLGVTKPVTLDVTLNQKGPNMMNKETVGFEATTTIKRSDFGMNTYVPKLGDEVPLVIEAEANADAPATPAAAK